MRTLDERCQRLLRIVAFAPANWLAIGYINLVQGTPLLVITGGYHSWGLFSGAPDPPPLPAEEAEVTDRGIALTPYSYERLDALVGYHSGMPNPGFYHRVWMDRQSGNSDSFRALLTAVVEGVRARKQQISAADLIAEQRSVDRVSLRAVAEIGRAHV